MSEPIPVREALKALRMAQEACNRAKPGDLESAADWVIMARAVLPGMVDGLIQGIEAYHGPDEAIKPDGYWHSTVAPIVQWARTREEWRR